MIKLQPGDDNSTWNFKQAKAIEIDVWLNSKVKSMEAKIPCGGVYQPEPLGHGDFNYQYCGYY